MKNQVSTGQTQLQNMDNLRIDKLSVHQEQYVLTLATLRYLDLFTFYNFPGTLLH